MRKVISIVVILLLFLAGVFGYQQYRMMEEEKKILSYDDCVAAGGQVLTSYPAQCVTKYAKKSFTQDIGNAEEYKDVITVLNPRPNQKSINPLKVTGQARGTWYFEATFPFELFDANGKSLGKGFATAEGEWMTEEFVPFTGELKFEKPTTEKGKLIITNANPSGLPENEKELVIPVVF